MRNLTLRIALPLLLVALPLTLTLAGCGGNGEEPVDQAPVEEAGATQQPGAGSPFEPMTSRSGGDAPAAAGGSLAWTAPAGWQERPPANSMRMAEYSVPGEAGAAETVVFYFGPGGGGGVEANIERWLGQMETPAGSQPERGEFRSGQYQVTWVEVPGTLKPSTMGSGPSAPQPDSRLLGAVVEGPGGPWFFKMTGPDDTVAAAREEFLAMLENLQQG
ncbi:MAG TPA: hypothetical protein VHG51_14750 [Longimicrobiaceae bacterium]|nr:hypothetical protein [Longimicrobiaceae bacterium]